MEDLQHLLVRLLAQADGLFAPWRFAVGSGSRVAAAAVWERRAAYHRTGLAITGGGSVAARQQHSRTMASGKASGLIEVRGGKTRPSVRLTNRGDLMTRSLTAAYSPAESWDLLKRLADCDARHPVLECDLLGSPDYSGLESRDLVGLENQMLPLLVRRWVESNSDLQGRLGYWATDIGRRVVTVDPPQVDDPPEMNNEAADLYAELYHATLVERDGWQPENRALVVIPLGAGSWIEHPGVSSV